MRYRVGSVALVVLMGFHPAAQRRTAFDLDRAGWEAIRANRLVEAADAFQEALRLDPRNVRVTLGAGLAAHLLGRSEEARQHLVAALQLEPSMTEASVLLGQILYGDGDLAGAIHVYEQAQAHAPGSHLLLTRLEAWRREVALHDRFTQRFGDHFTVLFEGPAEEALAGRVIELLEASYWRIGTALGAYPNGTITVVLYTKEQFRDVTRSPSWAAAAFDGRIRVPVQGALKNPRQLDRVLAHEFTHALTHSLAPRGVPQWLTEGLALFFEPGERNGARDLVARRAATAAEGEAGDGASIPLARLEESFHGLDAEQARHAYAQSAAAAQALVDRAGMIGVLNLLSYVGQGLPFPDAFERAVFVSYAEFRASWSAGRSP
jgi:tetratricopeptide (TPR) repeat protein